MVAEAVGRGVRVMEIDAAEITTDVVATAIKPCNVTNNVLKRSPHVPTTEGVADVAGPTSARPVAVKIHSRAKAVSVRNPAEDSRRDDREVADDVPEAVTVALQEEPREAVTIECDETVSVADIGGRTRLVR